MKIQPKDNFLFVSAENLSVPHRIRGVISFTKQSRNWREDKV